MRSRASGTLPERAYNGLREMARRAELGGDKKAASQIRGDLRAIDAYAHKELRTLSRKLGIPEAPATRSTPPTPKTSEPVAAAAAVPSPAGTSPESEWFPAYTSLRGLAKRFTAIGWHDAHLDFHNADDSITRSILRRFETLGGKKKELSRLHVYTKPEQAWQAIQDMSKEAKRSNDMIRTCDIQRVMAQLKRLAFIKLDMLTRKYGPIGNLASMSITALRTLQQPPARVEPSMAAAQPVQPAATPEQHATAPATTAPHPLATDPGARATPADGPLTLLPWVDRAQQWLVRHLGPLPEGPQTVPDVLWIPPGPGSRVMATQSAPAPVGSSDTPPALKTPATPGIARAATGPEDTGFAQRLAIVRRLTEHDAVQDAIESLRTGGAGALGWTAAQCDLVIQDVARLHKAARSDPAAATALADVDWDSIDQLIPILDVPPPSP